MQSRSFPSLLLRPPAAQRPRDWCGDLWSGGRGGRRAVGHSRRLSTGFRGLVADMLCVQDMSRAEEPAVEYEASTHPSFAPCTAPSMHACALLGGERISILPGWERWNRGGVDRLGGVSEAVGWWSWKKSKNRTVSFQRLSKRY